ncbi:MAG: FixH family protein [Roseiflexaceae bacterium]|nr:FixH family protein [Roseiflexaceae bacterium]
MRLFALFCIFALVLVGCTQATTRQKQTVDGVTIFLENPENISLSREVEVFVTLVAADERVINNATVTLDLDMPDMPMGQNRPLADPLGGGRYRIRTTYTMVGTWKTTVIAKIGEKEYRATFDQKVTD